MYARNNVKRIFHPKARAALAAAQRRFAAWVDVRVARWIGRCARNIEAAQGVFPDPTPAREFGMGRASSRILPTWG